MVSHIQWRLLFCTAIYWFKISIPFYKRTVFINRSNYYFESNGLHFESGVPSYHPMQAQQIICCVWCYDRYELHNAMWFACPQNVLTEPRAWDKLQEFGKNLVQNVCQNIHLSSKEGRCYNYSHAKYFSGISHCLSKLLWPYITGF